MLPIAAALVSVLLLGTPAGAQAVKPDLTRAEQGRCHMGSCSWAFITERDLIRSNDRSALFKLKILGGTSDNPKIYRKKEVIAWNKEPHELFVFCSKQLPATMIMDGNKLQVTILDLLSIYGVHESAASMYMSVCHNHRSLPTTKMVADFNYLPAQPESEAIADKIKQPLDILTVEY